eukprot:255405_1
MDEIFRKMHKMDRKVVAHRKCVYCDQNTPNGRNKLCEQCKRQHPEIIRHWQDVQRTLKGAKRRSIYRYKTCPLRRQYALSAVWAQNRLKQQQYRCYYFNIPLQFEPASPWTLSPERLDNSLGYTPDNTRFICRIFNSAGNTNPKYNITGSAQWNREKANIFLMHRFGINIHYHS